MAARATGGIWLGLAVLLGMAAGAPAADAPADSAAPGLAWRLDAISSTALGPSQPRAAWRRSAALLDAASRLDPSELRFLRLRALAFIQINDTAGAIAAVRDYRKAARTQHVADPAAQVRLIDLYASQQQTLDARLEYLRNLLNKQDIPPEVRSHVAVECAGLLAQKSKSEAAAMLKRAVELYPLPDATREYYEAAGRQQPLKQRLAALMAVLQASPEQPAYLEEMADLLARNGLGDDSLKWYDLAVAAVMRSGPARPPEFHSYLIEYASELIIASHGAASDTLLGQMLDEKPLDPDAWFLKLTESKASAEPVSYQQTLDLAKNAMVRRWNLLHDEILNGPAATQPAAAPQAAPAPAASQPAAEKIEPLDPAPVLQKLKGAHDAQSQDALVGVVSDLAWFELYYQKDAKSARQWIDVLRTVLAPKSIVRRRLEGWETLVSGHPQQARPIFEKVASDDPLSQLGLLRAQQAASRPADDAAAQKLLADHRTGLIGAILWDALRSDKTIPATQPQATEIQAQLAKFPQAWLGLADPRAVRRVYDLRAEPLDSHVAYGDPMLARVTITNNSAYDITISRDGLLRPDLWFDAQLLGLDQQRFRGVAYDQIADQIVLRAHASTSQVVRLDEGDLRKVLDVSPGAQSRIVCDAITNPVSLTDAVVPGPAGLAVNMRSMVYMGVPITMPSGKKQIEGALAGNSAADKLRALDLAAAYVRLASKPDADPAIRQATADLPAKIERLRKDPSPAVSAWAAYLDANIAPADKRQAIVNDMAASSDWATRLLSLFASGSLPQAAQRALAMKLAGDGDATVKAAADAGAQLLAEPATQPTTQSAPQPAAPATQPGSPAGI